MKLELITYKSRRRHLGYLLISIASFMFLMGCRSNHQKSEIERLAAAINEHPDLLHSDITPAVDRLVDIGMPAIPKLLDLMMSGDEPTRERSQRALVGITMTIHGFQFGKGWQMDQQEDNWRKLWMSLGSLNARDPAEKRAGAVCLWHQWLRKQVEQE